VLLAQAQATGLATAPALARALGVSLSTVRRARRRFEDGGIAGVVHRKRGLKGPRVGSEREKLIAMWKKKESARTSRR